MRLLDTDAIIDQLRTKEHRPGAISVITLIEVLRGTSQEKRTTVKELLEESYPTLNLDNPSILTYCDLYAKLKEEGRTLPDADLLIASAAISRGIPLETRDAHFQRLTTHGLELT